jgi:hypothetical protein
MATERQIAANRTNEKKHRSQNRGGQVEGEPQRLRRRQKPMPSRSSWPASRPATRSGWRQPRWRWRSPTCGASARSAPICWLRLDVRRCRLLAAAAGLRPLRKVGPHYAPTGIAQTLKSGAALDGFLGEPNFHVKRCRVTGDRSGLPSAARCRQFDHQPRTADAPARFGKRFSGAGGVWQNEPNFDATSISTMVAGSDDPATLALARIASEAEIELSQVRTSERKG